ncbi:hypothetical protein F4779DRAFT_640381 [Xylariaceae sp. FL0662B]|nr:hypothetical protein F4779DRAFT_640381 [Xylariaceae sp. FL0662B]
MSYAEINSTELTEVASAVGTTSVAEPSAIAEALASAVQTVASSGLADRLTEHFKSSSISTRNTVAAVFEQVASLAPVACSLTGYLTRYFKALPPSEPGNDGSVRAHPLELDQGYLGLQPLRLQWLAKSYHLHADSYSFSSPTPSRLAA